MDMLTSSRPEARPALEDTDGTSATCYTADRLLFVQHDHCDGWNEFDTKCTCECHQR